MHNQIKIGYKSYPLLFPYLSRYKVKKNKNLFDKIVVKVNLFAMKNYIMDPETTDLKNLKSPVKNKKL